jgi:hypothetical protein
MGERSYHGAMMNVQPKYPNGRVRMDCSLEYKEGHRDARHECADIANMADAEIAALKSAARDHEIAAEEYAATRAENERLRGKLKEVRDHGGLAYDDELRAQLSALLGEGGEG